MHSWEAIQKTIDHIEEHIDEEIKTEELARIAALSVFYYQRLFARLIKAPVQEYIKLRRLALAARWLRENDELILDVAIQYGFNNRETFARSFKETYGITPAQYRDNPVALHHFDKPDLLLSYVMVDEGVPLISEGMVLEMSRKTCPACADFLGVAGHLPFQFGRMLGERPGPNRAGRVFEDFLSIKKDIPALAGGRYMGVCYRGDAPDGHTTYFAGAEVETGSHDKRFASFRLPAREYVICAFEAEGPTGLSGASDSFGALVGKAMKYTRFWLKDKGLIADGFFPEMYYPGRPGPAYMEIWVPFKERAVSSEP